MPITRKHQIAAKLETAEGTDIWGGSPPASTDVVRVYDPQVQDSTEFDDTVPSGASLSRDYQAVGRQGRSMTFGADFVGNNTGATDTLKRNAVPPWDAFVRASSTKRVDMTLATGTVTAGPFYPGEKVGDASWAGSPTNWGIAANDGVGGLFIVPIVGDFGSATAVYGQASGASIGTATIDTTEGLAYLPDSLQTVAVNLTVAGWSAATPSDGDVLLIKRSGEQVGSCRIVTIGDPALVSLVYGSIANGDELHAADGSYATAEASAAVVAVNSPSISIYSNLDGEARRLLGGRGDFTLGGETGKVLKFAFTMQGSPDDEVDELQIAGVSLSTLAAPKFAGAIFSVGYDRDAALDSPTGTAAHFGTCIPAKSIEFAPGNSIEDRRGQCAASGVISARVVDRDPQLTIEFEKVGVGAFDWKRIMRRGVAVRLGFVIGTAVGNRVGIVLPSCQVVEVTDGEADGLATNQVTLRPRRLREAGDDEFALIKY